MTQRQIQLTLAAITLASLAGVIVLLCLGKAVPTELYAFLGVGFGGHLALASPAPASTVNGAITLGLDELRNLIAMVPPPSSAKTTSTAPVSTSATQSAASVSQHPSVVSSAPGANVAAGGEPPSSLPSTVPA